MPTITPTQFSNTIDTIHRLQRGQLNGLAGGLGSDFGDDFFADTTGDSGVAASGPNSYTDLSFFGQTQPVVQLTQSGGFGNSLGASLASQSLPSAQVSNLGYPSSATSGLTTAQIAQLIAAGTNGAATALRIANTGGIPTVIPGTSLVYDPSTGRIIPSSGALLSGSGSLNTLFTSPVLLIGLGLAAVLLLGRK